MHDDTEIGKGYLYRQSSRMKQEYRGFVEGEGRNVYFFVWGTREFIGRAAELHGITAYLLYSVGCAHTPFDPIPWWGEQSLELISNVLMFVPMPFSPAFSIRDQRVLVREQVEMLVMPVRLSSMLTVLICSEFCQDKRLGGISR